MLDLVDAALGILASGLAIVAGILRAKNKKSAKKLEDTYDAVTESGTEEAGPQGEIPYKVQRSEIRTSFDNSGEGTYMRKVSGLTVRQSCQNLRVPFRFTALCPGALLERPDVQELDGSPPMTIVDLDFTSSSAKGFVEVIGLISPSDDPISYELKQPFKNAYCLTRQEAEQAYGNDKFKAEYVAELIHPKTDILEINLSLPESHKAVKTTAVAFVGSSEVIHEKESEKVKGNLVTIGRESTLTVERPLSTIQYAISWMPPKS